MGHEKIGLREFGRAGRAQHRGDIVLVVAETVDVAHERVVNQPVGQPLSAPVDGDGGKAARGKIGRRRRVFLDVLGAAGEQQHGSSLRLVPPGGHAQAHAVLGLNPPRGPVVGPGADVGEERRPVGGHALMLHVVARVRP